MSLRYAKLLLAICLFGLLTQLALTWSRRVDVGSADRYGRGLRSAFALELSLTSEVMRAQSGLAAHYDDLVSIERRLAAQLALLQEPPSFLPTPERMELKQTVTNSERARRETEDRVESFKSEHAVLRNSLRFLPVASNALDAYVARTAEEQRFKDATHSLVRDVLLLQSVSDGTLLARARSRLAALPIYDVSIGTAAAPPELLLVLRHIRIAIERTPRIAELVRQVSERPDVGLAEASIARYEYFLARARATANQDTDVSYALLLLCVLSTAIAIILRLRESAQVLRRTGKELEQAIAALHIEQEKQRELADLKSRFVAMTSHEFRTPLSAIMSSSEMLEAYADRWPEEKRKQHWVRIYKSVRAMIRMLDGVLMVGKSDAGLLEFKPVPFDLGRFCAEAVETAIAACNGDHAIVLEASDTDQQIVADEVLLRHVVDNLLSNAIKYSPRGSRVCLRIARDGEEVLLEVSDQGLGIPVGDQVRLFETFQRGSNVSTISGTGLGLAIAKRAVDLHGGSLSLVSELGNGALFTVRLPCPKHAA